MPIELVWWPREFAEASVAALFEGEASSSADALVHGVALRTTGLLARWQAQLRDYPDELAAARIENAALSWGGYAPEGMLTIARPGERLALVGRLLDDATRVLQILYALNRVWPPTDQARGGSGSKRRPSSRSVWPSGSRKRSPSPTRSARCWC